MALILSLAAALRFRSRLAALFGIALMIATGCAAPAEPDPVELPSQDVPHDTGIPDLGVHADRGNTDVIACESSDAP